MKIKVSKQVKISLCNGLETYNGKVAKVLPKNDNLLCISAVFIVAPFK
jgi:hypothetical protein